MNSYHYNEEEEGRNRNNLNLNNLKYIKKTLQVNESILCPHRTQQEALEVINYDRKIKTIGVTELRINPTCLLFSSLGMNSHLSPPKH